MTTITGILHLDNGEQWEFEAIEGEIQFTDTDNITEAKSDELFDELENIIRLA